MTRAPGALLLGAYRYAATLFAPAAGPLLRRRLRRGREDPARLRERLGHPGLPRPPGRLVWLHGASVGEGVALLPLVERLVAADLRVLVTTGTVTSARVLAGRLPPGAVHQFVPLDIPAAMARFLQHWRPALVLLAESELWPVLIGEARARGVPVAIVNGRMSPRSFARWRRLPGAIGALLGELAACLAQGPGDAERFGALGAPLVAVTGNLKFDAAAPPADPDALAALRAAVGGRPLWVAASTHPDEEPLLLGVHARLAARHPGLLTVLVPRHPERGGSVAAAAAAAGLRAARRSAGEPLDATTAVYVADTVGELGLFFRVGDLVFMGKSLGGGGGQNPIEPAKLGCAILHGPAVGNFPDVYALLAEARGAREVADPAELAAALDALLADRHAREALATAGRGAVEAQAGAADRILRALAPLLRAARP